MSHRYWLILTWLGAACGVGAAPSSPETGLHPWCSDNAVLASPEVRFGGEFRKPGLSGFASPGLERTLRIALSPSRDRWLEPDFATGKFAGGSPDLASWTLAEHALRSGLGRSARAGEGFEVQLAEKDGRKISKPRAVVTNLVVGPVWVVVVVPDLDDVLLPALTEDVRRRIRLLPLDGAPGGPISRGWISAREGERETNRLFCGLPRAFARLLVENVPESQPDSAVIGLVLINGRQSTTEWTEGRKLAGWQPRDRDEQHPFLRAAVTNANEANFVEPYGGERRNKDARRAHLRQLLDWKREGRLGEAYRHEVPRWEWVHVGDQPGLPFRVHGVIR